GCPVTFDDISVIYRVIVTLESGLRSNANGSDRAASPGGIVIADCPLNVNRLSVPGLIESAPAEVAICAVFITTASVPNALDKRTRNWLPPSETCTICRNVLPLRPGSGGILR